MIETRYCVQEGHERTPGDFCLDIVCTAYIVDCTQRTGINPAVVHNQPSFTLPAVLGELLSGKRRSTPGTIAPDALPSVYFFLQLLVHPLGLSPFEIVRRKSAGRSSRDGVVCKVKYRGTGGARHPEGCRLPPHHLRDGSYIFRARIKAAESPRLWDSASSGREVAFCGILC